LLWPAREFCRNATVADQVFVVFAGKIYAEQPTWLTVPDFLWARFRRELGMSARTDARICRHSDDELCG
jgi:hypothetical protein